MGLNLKFYAIFEKFRHFYMDCMLSITEIYEKSGHNQPIYSATEFNKNEINYLVLPCLT
jgi:hypothetical protein